MTTEKENPATDERGTDSGTFGCIAVLVVAGLSIWLAYVSLLLPYLELSNEKRNIAAEVAVESEIRSRLPSAQIVLEEKSGGHLYVYLENDDFESVPYPNRDDFVRKVGQTWCAFLGRDAIFNLSSMKIKDVRSGATLGSHSCAWEKLWGEESGLPKDALALAESAYKKSPESYHVNADLGHLYFEQFQRDPNRNPDLRQRSVQLLERAAELNPTASLPLSSLGAIYREAGWDQDKRGHTDRAEELEGRALSYLSAAVSLGPEDLWAFSNLGDVRKDLGMIWARRGNSSQAETERRLALEAYRQAIALGSPDPRFPLVYFKLAMVMVDQRRFGEAVPWLEKSVSAPGLADMWELPYWMGSLLSKLAEIRSSTP